MSIAQEPEMLQSSYNCSKLENLLVKLDPSVPSELHPESLSFWKDFSLILFNTLLK